MKAKKKETIYLPEDPLGGRQEQYPMNCYPITANDVIEVIARGITAYMNERLTKFHAIAYNPENIALREVNEQLKVDLVNMRKANEDLKRYNEAFKKENTALRAETAIWDRIREIPFFKDLTRGRPDVNKSVRRRHG